MTRTARVLAAAAVAVALLAGSAVAAVSYLSAPPSQDGPIALLVIGSDAGPPRGGDPLTGRADGLHLLVVSADRRDVSILDFPRDLYVPVAGRGTTKINACLNGGPDTCVDTVQSLTGMTIHAWYLTDFRGFAAGVDLMGGLELEVDRPLHDPYSGTNLDPGTQVVDGGQALAFARDRKSRPGGDFDRTAAHATLLKALHRQIVTNPSVIRIGELVTILRKTTVTDADTAFTLRLAYLAPRISPGRVRSAVVDGRIGTAGAASVVYLTAEGEALIADLREDGRLDATP